MGTVARRIKLILAIDIGNTNGVLGAFEEDDSSLWRAYLQIQTELKTKAVIIKSVLENHGAYSSDISGTIYLPWFHLLLKPVQKQ